MRRSNVAVPSSDQRTLNGEIPINVHCFLRSAYRSRQAKPLGLLGLRDDALAEMAKHDLNGVNDHCSASGERRAPCCLNT